MLIHLTQGSWKTTSAGLTIVMLVLIDVGWAWQTGSLTKMDLMTAVPQLLSGVGLLVARDNDKSSEDVGVK